MSETNQRPLRLIRDADELRRLLYGRKLALVMTSGRLHAGHAELIKQARGDGHDVVVTIYDADEHEANEPIGADEFYLHTDVELAAAAGAFAVFAPSKDALFPFGVPRVLIEQPDLYDCVRAMYETGAQCGDITQMQESLVRIRTELTKHSLVTVKLLNLVRPDRVFAGQNDCLRLANLRNILRDLDYQTQLVVIPTSRDLNGMALSRVNERLSDAAYNAALALNRALRVGVQEAAALATREQVLAAAWRELDDSPELVVDYLALVDPVTLGEPEGTNMFTATLAVGASIEGVELRDSSLVMIRRIFAC